MFMFKNNEIFNDCSKLCGVIRTDSWMTEKGNEFLTKTFILFYKCWLLILVIK